jgi:hypothetical protein
MPNMNKGRSQIFRGKEFNEIELLYSTKKKVTINRTISNANLLKYSPVNFHQIEQNNNYSDNYSDNLGSYKVSIAGFSRSPSR